MNEQLKNKVKSITTQTALGEAMGLSSQAVSRWMNSGKVPTSRVRALCMFLNWQVTPHEIDPEAYPNPTDGLPKQEG